MRTPLRAILILILSASVAFHAASETSVPVAKQTDGARQELAQSATGQPERVTVDWAIEKPLQSSGARPAYPALAAQARIEGAVRVQFVVGLDGATKEITVLSGHPLLMKAATDAVSSWHFRPTLVGGVPAEVQTIAPVLFFLAANDAATYLAPFQKAAEKHPKDISAHEAYARALLNIGDAEKASSEFREIISLQPNYAQGHFGLGDSLGAKGDTDSAIREYREGLSMKPKDGEAHYALAKWLEAKGDLDAAVEEYRVGLKLGTKTGNEYFLFGLLLMKKGDVDGAISAYREELHSGSFSPPTHYELGRALEQKGDSDAALKEYDKALKLWPENAYMTSVP